MHAYGPNRVGTDLPGHAIREALGRSAGDRPVEVRVTHAAWVLLAGDRAYKVKKPVRMDVQEFDALEQRRLACLEELRVNRELAPGTVLRVRALVPAAGSGSLALAGEHAADAVEYAIEMRRFDEARTMASLSDRGLLTDEQVAAVAQRLVAFHAAAPRFAPIDPVSAVVRGSGRNVRELLLLTGDDAAVRSVRAVARFTDAFLFTHGREIAARAELGFIRDGHGDLRARNVVLDEELTIIGRVASDPRLREIDVAQDVAALVMDLEHIGDQRAAELLVQCYWDAAGELCSPELLAFHGAHRALVRAKVELQRAHHCDASAVAPARERAGELLRHAERLAWRARGPMVLVVGGASPLAAELARRSGIELLSSPAGATPYRALGERARKVVFDGHAAIVDATFEEPSQCDAFIEGLRDSGPVYMFDHRAPPAGATIPPPGPSAGVEHTVDRIAAWLDARHSAVHPPE